MKVTAKKTDGSLHFYFDGELDEYSALKAKTLLDKIIDENMTVNRAVFNLSKLTFMDSTGIGLLIGRYKRLNAVGIKCFWEQALPNVQKVIEISGLNGLIPQLS